MSKELPYFKFFTDDWLLGRIMDLPAAAQGRFITFCAMYWRRNCDVSIEFWNKSVPKVTRKLLESESLIEVKKQKIKIKFLDEQYAQRIELQRKRRKGGLARAEAYAEASAPANGQVYKNKEVEVEVEVDNHLDDDYITAVEFCDRAIADDTYLNAFTIPPPNYIKSLIKLRNGQSIFSRHCEKQGKGPRRISDFKSHLTNYAVRMYKDLAPTERIKYA